MIKEVQGNLLAADVDALVNTVNTVGVMGKGIALQFKKAYPDMFRAYQAAAKAGDLRIGHMHVWETGLLSGPRFIVNFPTKKHWRQPSRLEEVADGLQDLKRVVRELGITSIALPPLGCGNGGLNLNPPLAVRRGNAEMPFCLEKMGVLDTSRSQGEGHLLDATVTHTGGIVSVV